MRSRLYEGTVWHERTRPAYRLHHSVFYLNVDLAETGLLHQRARIFSHNSFNIFSLHDADYDMLTSLKGMEDTPNQPGRAMSLLTIPRILGYAFNPVSFFLVRGPQGGLERVFAEVHNTWGERYVYDLVRSADADAYRSRATKAFYVSPFLEAEGEYQFEIREHESGQVTIRITESTAGEEVFAAGMSLRPSEMTTASLLMALVRNPLLNLKVIGAIHWHALRIWLGGARFHPHEKNRDINAGG